MWTLGQRNVLTSKVRINLPCPGQIQTYFLKNSLCLAAVFKLLATGLETCLTAKLTNLNKGNAPTTILKTEMTEIVS